MALPSFDNATQTVNGIPVRDVRWNYQHKYWEGLVWMEAHDQWIPCYWNADGACLCHPNYDLRHGNKKWKTVGEISELETGMVVRNKGSENAYIITANHLQHATAVRTIEITNPSEWEVLK